MKIIFREARQQYLAKGIDLEDDCVLAEVRTNTILWSNETSSGSNKRDWHTSSCDFWEAK